MARLTVIVPVYNARKYIGKCLNSLVNQTMNDIEIIAINDGSTDSSLDIMQQFEKKYQNKVKIIDIENSGAAFARNKGLDMATGEFIKFVDADDYINLDILNKMYNVAKRYNVKLVIGNYTKVLGPLKKVTPLNLKGFQYGIIDVRKNKDYIVDEMPGIGNKLIHRDLIDNLRFPEGLKWEDLAFMPIVMASSEKLFHMNESVYNYRLHLSTTLKDSIFKNDNFFDCFTCIKTVEFELKKRNLYDIYESQVKSLYIIHVLARVREVMTWSSISYEQKSELINSFVNVLDVQCPNWQQNKKLIEYEMNDKYFRYCMNKLKTYQDKDNTLSLQKRLKKVLTKF